MTALLRVDDLTVTFGAVRANDGVCLDVREGEVMGLVGPNGSGKSTLLKSIVGVVRPSSGSVLFGDRDITRWRVEKIARMGLVATTQSDISFPGVTVAEGLQLALSCAGSLGERSSGLGELQTPADILAFVGLDQVADEHPSALSTGYSRKLGVALALATAPRMLLLDEPAAGLTSSESLELAELVRKIRAMGTTMVVVDHDMSFLLPCCDRVTVLAVGRNFARGTPDEIIANDDVAEIYLGRRDLVRGGS